LGTGELKKARKLRKDAGKCRGGKDLKLWQDLFSVILNAVKDLKPLKIRDSSLRQNDTLSEIGFFLELLYFLEILIASQH
jgi:hypothetical protein